MVCRCGEGHPLISKTSSTCCTRGEGVYASVMALLSLIKVQHIACKLQCFLTVNILISSYISCMLVRLSSTNIHTLGCKLESLEWMFLTLPPPVDRTLIYICTYSNVYRLSIQLLVFSSGQKFGKTSDQHLHECGPQEES